MHLNKCHSYSFDSISRLNLHIFKAKHPYERNTQKGIVNYKLNDCIFRFPPMVKTAKNWSSATVVKIYPLSQKLFIACVTSNIKSLD